jgi:hypothetical protein
MRLQKHQRNLWDRGRHGSGTAARAMPSVENALVLSVDLIHPLTIEESPTIVTARDVDRIGKHELSMTWSNFRRGVYHKFYRSIVPRGIALRPLRGPEGDPSFFGGSTNQTEQLIAFSDQATTYVIGAICTLGIAPKEFATGSVENTDGVPSVAHMRNRAASAVADRRIAHFSYPFEGAVQTPSWCTSRTRENCCTAA